VRAILDVPSELCEELERLTRSCRNSSPAAAAARGTADDAEPSVRLLVGEDPRLVVPLDLAQKALELLDRMSRA
jgi:hypothetical protein